MLSVSDAILDYDFEVTDRLLADQVVFRNNSVEGETTAKYDVTWQIAPGATLRSGVSWKRRRRHLEIAQPLGVETPFSTKPRDQVEGVLLDLTPTAQIFGGHLQLSAPRWARTRLTAGARLDRFDVLGDTTVSPRVGVETRLSPRLAISVSAGRYHQQPELTSIVAHPENAGLARHRRLRHAWWEVLPEGHGNR